MENSEDRRARVDPEINRPLNSLDVTPLRKSRTPLEIFKKVGIPIIAAVLILATIIVVAVLIKVILDSYFFFCGQPLLFIPREQVCDGHQDCASGEDEKYCVKKLPDGPPVAVRLSRDRSTLQVLNPATKNWASACFDSFTEALAKTACRQMGYDRYPAQAANPPSELWTLAQPKIWTSSKSQRTCRSFRCKTQVEYIMRNAGLDEAQAGIKIARRNINHLRYADDTTLMAESEEELKSLLMKVKEGSEKADLNLNLQKTKIMASGPITSWQIDGETIVTVTDFIFLGSKITADGDCSHEIGRCLLLRRKAMTNLDSMLKSRDITLPTKVHLVKAMVFPVVMYGCESWTMKKAECRRIGAFELCCWRRLLGVPWTARRSNQSILKEISPEYSLEGLMLKVKLNTLAT
ncbi:transmembrane protease serine 4 isoform X3 [Bos taurus]|uniref:transmembrane protease serine 4 isoform X3 n=1 Tax=Bos taurus TaxID=9913 RepID=UPI0028CB53F3|nr:transmembrane protease serine 4 isoform X3 [Bos taurus]